MKGNEHGPEIPKKVYSKSGLLAMNPLSPDTLQ
jgi:hypothetical protein